MSQVVEDTLARLSCQNCLQIVATTLEDVLGMDHLARKTAAEAVQSWQQGM
jgi:1-deoxy-D-xylulose-5-phosphate reductoisomerase